MQYRPAERVSVDGFLVYYRRYDMSATDDDTFQTDLVADVTARSAVIDRLHAATQYTLYIKCFNTHGASPPSNVVVQHTLPGMWPTQKRSPYSITDRRVPELILVLGSQPAGAVRHKHGGRLPLLSARPAVTFAP